MIIDIIKPNIKTCLINFQSPVVMWKMKAPEKKPLVRRENPDDTRVKVRKGASKKKIEPLKLLSEFQERDSFA